MSTTVGSMTAGQFWSELKIEADAVSWNLRDVVRNNSDSCNGSVHSLNRAIASSERICSMIAERTANFKQQIASQRLQKR